MARYVANIEQSYKQPIAHPLLLHLQLLWRGQSEIL